MAALGHASCEHAGVLVATTRQRAIVAVIAVVHLGLLALGGALPDGPMLVLLRSDPHSEKAIVESSAAPEDILDSAWSPLGRLDVLRSLGVPSRFGVFF